MLKARWTQFGPPSTPSVVFVRNIGEVRVTQQDIDRYGDMPGDPEILCERIDGDPEATHRISGLAPEAPGVRERFSAPGAGTSGARPHAGGAPRRGARRRSWLDVLLGR
jgi:hypothetical protein